MTPPDQLVTIEVSTARKGRRAQIANYANSRDATMQPMRVPADALPEEIKARAKELFDLGFSTIAVARRIGVQPKTLRVLIDNEISISTIERRNKVSSMVAEGCNLNEIAERLGVAEWFIRSDLQAMHINPSRLTCKAKAMKERKADVLRLHQQGKTVTEITRELNLSASQVQYALDRLGVQWRTRPRSARHAAH
jgi:DNA-binding CsgD family transcriptional regulator